MHNGLIFRDVKLIEKCECLFLKIRPIISVTKCEHRDLIVGNQIRKNCNISFSIWESIVCLSTVVSSAEHQ